MRRTRPVHLPYLPMLPSMPAIAVEYPYVSRSTVSNQEGIVGEQIDSYDPLELFTARAIRSTHLQNRLTLDVPDGYILTYGVQLRI